ncbi:MAG: putative family peptidase [Gemmatimonadetes bacterium]|nr:putative family peptidase [Gemmatimonadota bacterium]
MAVVEQTVSLTEDTLSRIQDELRALGLDGWLLYNFHGNNPIAARILGLPAMTRRWFVLLPAEGRPVAVTHRIEQQPWTGWIGENRPYLAWRELEERLADLVRGRQVALEYSAADAVPYVDLVPAGVVEMLSAAGARLASSADLVSAFYARWSDEGLASHRRAATTLHAIVHEAFARAAAAVKAGETITELELRRWIAGEQAARGLTVGAEAIVAVNGNAANPHYAPTAENHAPIREGDTLLIDLWGKEEGDDAVYADQTWMAYVGAEVPDRIRAIWEAARDARLAACALVRQRWDAGEPVTGCELDDASRSVIVQRGFGEAFIHRTGHSIDRELHGSGPNIDNLETRDTRRLIPGVGFSIEPGIYLAGDVGFRTEVDVYMGPDGPEVTTPNPQTELYPLLHPDFGR